MSLTRLEDCPVSMSFTACQRQSYLGWTTLASLQVVFASVTGFFQTTEVNRNTI